MVASTSVTYQPAVAYQGGQQINTPEQEPKSGRTQPAQAASADTHRTGERTHGLNDSTAPPSGQGAAGRGSTVDFNA